MEIEGPLPEGMVARPLTMADTRGVYEVMAALQRAETGLADIEEADVLADWQQPSVDVPSVTMGVFEGDRLVGYAEASKSGFGDAAVHPDRHGRGIGTALARWMQTRSRELDANAIGMPVPRGKSGDRLLEALGYHVRWTSWVLQVPWGATIPDRPLPEDHEARPEEYRAVHQVIDDAFLEWSVRDPEPFEDFEAGAVVEGYVARLAVRGDQRGRGLAQALLADAFRLARDHGAPACGLATDSRTGALALYEKVGMVVTQTWVNRAIAL
ncbi:MAG: GNAT family N-acetyltransferase [Dermatophilaceae bacterium]